MLQVDSLLSEPTGKPKSLQGSSNKFMYIFFNQLFHFCAQKVVGAKFLNKIHRIQALSKLDPPSLING